MKLAVLISGIFTVSTVFAQTQIISLPTDQALHVISQAKTIMAKNALDSKIQLDIDWHCKNNDPQDLTQEHVVKRLLSEMSSERKMELGCFQRDALKSDVTCYGNDGLTHEDGSDSYLFEAIIDSNHEVQKVVVSAECGG